MSDLDPIYVNRAKQMLRQGIVEAQTANELIRDGVSAEDAPRYVSQAAWQLKSDKDRLAQYQTQALIGMALGGIGLVVGGVLGGAVISMFLATGMLVFSGLAWIIAKFFDELALWFADRGLVIFVLCVVIVLAAGILFTALRG